MARRKNWLASSLIALMRLHYQQGHSIKELARVYRVHPSVAANICHGRTHRRVVAADPSDGISLEDVARRMGVTERSPEKEGRRRPPCREAGCADPGTLSEGAAHLGVGRGLRSPSERGGKHLSRTDPPASAGSRGEGDSPTATEAPPKAVNHSWAFP